MRPCVLDLDGGANNLQRCCTRSWYFSFWSFIRFCILSSILILDINIWSLILMLDLDVWSWCLILMFDLDLWSWSLILTFGLDLRSWYWRDLDRVEMDLYYFDHHGFMIMSSVDDLDILAPWSWSCWSFFLISTRDHHTDTPIFLSCPERVCEWQHKAFFHSSYSAFQWNRLNVVCCV